MRRIGLKFGRKLLQYKWGLMALTVGVVGSGGSLRIVHILSARATGGLGVTAMILAFIGSVKDRAPWLSLVALGLGMFCIAIVSISA